MGARPRPDTEAVRPPRLSVTIVSYECRELLAACLASLEREREREPFETIVVDNTSRDGTVQLVRERFPWVELVASGENLGFARATNLALERAGGDFLLVLNPDTIVPDGALSAVVGALASRPGVGMLGCKLVRPDGSLDHACKRGFPTPLTSLYHFLGLSRALPSHPRFARYPAGHVDPDEEAAVDAVNGAFMLVRRSAIEAVGLMDEDYWLYMEDLDWCYRFWQAGQPVLYWPGATVVHVKAGSTSRFRPWTANRAFHRGMWIFYRKHYAASRSPVVTAAVWTGIWTKLGISALRSALARRRRDRRS